MSTYNRTFDHPDQTDPYNALTQRSLNRIEGELAKMLDATADQSWAVDNQQDGTGSITRSLDTTFTNASGQQRLVVVSLDHTNAGTGSTGEARSEARIDPAGSNTLVANTQATDDGAEQTDTQPLIFLVQPGQDYRVDDTSDSGATLSIRFWHEFDFDQVYSAQSWSTGDTLEGGSPSISTWTGGIANTFGNVDIADDGTLDVTTQFNDVRGVFARDDGEKFYVVGDDDNGNPHIAEFDLGTDWDVAGSATLNQESNLPSTDVDNPSGVFFRDDGKRMYVCYRTSHVQEFHLSTAWDTSTRSLDHTVSISEDGNVQGLYFKPDGSKMLLTGAENADVYEYTLSTDWDISTLTFQQSFSPQGGQGAHGIYVHDDGNLMFVMHNSPARVEAYEFSTAWDLSTVTHIATFDESLNLAKVGDQPHDVHFARDGLTMYIPDRTNANIEQYGLSSMFTLKSEFKSVPTTFHKLGFAQQVIGVGSGTSSGTAEVQLKDSGGTFTSIAEVGTTRLLGERSECVPTVVNAGGDHRVSNTSGDTTTSDPRGSFDAFPVILATSFNSDDSDDQSERKWKSFDQSASNGWNTTVNMAMTAGLGSADFPRTPSSTAWSFLVFTFNVDPGTGSGQCDATIEGTSRAFVDAASGGVARKTCVLVPVPPSYTVDFTTQNNSTLERATEWVVQS